MIDWRKPDERLVAILAEAMQPFICQKRIMFGCPAYFTNDNMFAGVFAESIYVRLPAAEREQMLAEQPQATVFEPMPGRPMKEYISLPRPVVEDPDLLGVWLEKAYAYALALPPRAGKAKKRK